MRAHSCVFAHTSALHAGVPRPGAEVFVESVEPWAGGLWERAELLSSLSHAFTLIPSCVCLPRPWWWGCGVQRTWLWKKSHTLASGSTDPEKIELHATLSGQNTENSYMLYIDCRVKYGKGGGKLLQISLFLVVAEVVSVASLFFIALHLWVL